MRINESKTLGPPIQLLKQNIRITLQPQSKTFGSPYNLKAKHSDHPTASKQNIWTTLLCKSGHTDQTHHI